MELHLFHALVVAHIISGTTGAVARRLGRRFIGIEREAHYAAAARERIARVAALPAAALAPVAAKRSEPRIPFAVIVEEGLVRPGEILVDARKQHAVTVRADGAVSLGRITGSIHKIGALAQGLPACNGWTYWHYEREGRLQPIDSLREILRGRRQG